MHLNPSKEPTRLSRLAVAITWLAATAGAIAALLVGASSAEGGVYRAVQCSPGLGAGHPDLSFERNSDHYVSEASCQSGRGLSVRHNARRSQAGRWGGWSLRAPEGTVLRRLTTKALGSASAGHEPELSVGLPGSGPTVLEHRPGGMHHVRWKGEGATSFQARLRCERSGGCGKGATAKLRFRRLAVQLLDDRAPATELGGPLAAGRTQRGTRTLEAIASDEGSGLWRVFLHVNGEPVAARSLDCALRQGVATRLRPCPRAAEPSFDLDTAGSPFRQGPNRLRACTLDYATASDRNRDCATRRVRIDNACPVDAGSEAGRLEARIAGGKRAISHGEPARLVGRLVDDSGSGIAGAEVCVATRVDLHGARERVVATPTTSPGGQFEARLEPGPSREVRVAHWPDSERVAESYERLRVRAQPGLQRRPRGTLRNGDRVRFSVRLHGPRAEGRRAHLKVRSAGRWLRLRTGRTNARGRWAAAYRFRSTTGTRVYRFRAFVPSQADYPFEGGRSEVREVRVVG